MLCLCVQVCQRYYIFKHARGVHSWSMAKYMYGYSHAKCTIVHTQSALRTLLYMYVSLSSVHDLINVIDHHTSVQEWKWFR